MSLFERLFKNRKRNEGTRLMYVDDADSVSSDPSYEDAKRDEEQGTEEKKKEEPEVRSDFLNQLFF